MESTDRRRKCQKLMKDFFYGFVTEYETQKIVMVRSYTVTTLLRILQMILLSYSVFYLIIYEKGYQKQDTAIISSITLKVKGIGYVETSTNETHIIDGADYIIPASENNAIFIMTNFIETDQNRSQCQESASLPEAICSADRDCRNKPYMPNANGRWTGRCIISTSDNGPNTTSMQPIGRCEMQGWCPAEDDEQAPKQIHEIRNFTVFIKNFIEFPMFGVKHKNMVENLRHCVFHPKTNKDCPIFRLDYIIREAEKNVSEQEIMLRHGGVIRVKLNWDCNLDRRISLCKPKYSFARLDTPSYEEKFSLGFNFRFAYHWKQGETSSRALTKAYGLRLIISVSGRAGKFDFITLTLNIGSIVGIFGLATFVCDIILLNMTKKAPVYRDFIFQRVDTESLERRASRKPFEESGDISMVFSNPLSDMSVPIAAFELSDLSVIHDHTCCTSPASDVLGAGHLQQCRPSLGLTNRLH